MSSGSKGPAPSKRAGLVKKVTKSAHEILEERELRNAKAKTNMLLHDAKKESQRAEEFQEPGTALKLLEQKGHAKQEEYGAWKSDEDPHGLLGEAPPWEDALEEKEEPDDEADAEDLQDEADAAEPGDEADAAEPDDEEDAAE